MTNEKIRSIALELFAQKGYEGTSMSDIAKGVGIQKSSIYSHLTSKEELYVSIFENILLWDMNCFKGLVEKFSHQNIEENLYSIFKHYCKLYTDESANDKIMFLNRAMLFPPQSLKDKLQSIFEDYEKIFNMTLINVIEEGMEKKVLKKRDIKEVLSFFYCIVDGLFVESCYYPRHEYRVRFDSIWSLFWETMKA